MKTRNYIIILLSLLGAGCSTLDIENIYDYDAEQVWNDEKLANAYVTNLYGNIFGNWSVSADQNSQQLNGIHFYENRVTVTNGEYKNWDYYIIRKINEAIKFTTEGTLPQDVKDQIIGQALFMRAYRYASMVTYHGGVPYIKVPQDRYEDDLYVTRTSTAECFDNIVADLDEAIRLLPEKIAASSNDFGRIDGCYASAFKAKVLLLKASPLFNPKNPYSNAFWNDAYEANKTAYEKLIANGAALVADYSKIWLQERGPEVVFSVINSYPNKVANCDNGCRPGSESRGNAWASPTWEFVKEFPMADGKQYNDPSGKYYCASETDFLTRYWENRDPRFEKSVVWNGKIYEVSNKKNNRQYTALGLAHEADDFGINPAVKLNCTNLNSYSGFFMLKGCDLSLLQAEVQQYDIDYIVMRFAEVMMNYAEAANEAGHSETAIDLLKQIRQRAGIEAGSDGNYGMNLSSRESIRQAILDERNIEFCFEGHRFWDLRRTRNLHLLDGTVKHGIESIAINPNGSDMEISTAKSLADQNTLTESAFRYVIHQIPFSGVRINTVPDTYYFFPIQKDVIDKNSNIEQNSNWGGSFNPALE